MGIRVNFEIEDHIIVLAVTLCFVLWFTGGFSTLNEYLEEKHSILAIHGTLLTGLIALFVGFITVNAVRFQIKTELNERHLQRTINSGIYFEAAKDFLDQVQLNLNLHFFENVQVANVLTTTIEFNEKEWDGVIDFPLPSIIYDWNYLSMVPAKTIRQHIQVRNALKAVQSCRQEFRKTPMNTRGKFPVSAAKWKVFQASYSNARGILREIESQIDIHPDLRP